MKEVQVTITGPIFVEPTSGWTAVEWPGSNEILGTGKTVKVSASADGIPFDVTLMPTGKGHHMVPLRKDLRKKLGKDVGDVVAITIVATR